MPYDITEDDLEQLMEEERIADICNEYMESLEEEILNYNKYFDNELIYLGINEIYVYFIKLI